VNFLRRIMPETIASQIACLVIVAVLLGVALASVALLHVFSASAVGANGEILPSVRAARIAGIVKMAQETRSAQELARTLETTRSPAVAVEAVPMASLASPFVAPSPFVAAIEERLTKTWGVTPLPNGTPDAVLVRIDDHTALKFEAAPNFFPLHNVVLIQMTFALAIVTVVILLLSLYALKRITAPLSAIALAARSIGHDAEESAPIKGTGPREIKQVAQELQGMRERMNRLVDERTHMLEAISHDLRTPLTRLRLRAERLADERSVALMLEDISIINDMVGDTLAFLRNDGREEPVDLVDLPSLLQTICAQFSDIGHDVTYAGPARLSFACRAHALSRAVANIVDNAAKHGDHVTVTLWTSSAGEAQIEVADDGPGIPESMREKAFEPFFKGDSARASPRRGGFGLGLPIARNIIRQHGGDVELKDAHPHGLRVRLSLVRQSLGAPVHGDARVA
jgi:signal transduction histidine kinase